MYVGVDRDPCCLHMGLASMYAEEKSRVGDMDPPLRLAAKTEQWSMLHARGTPLAALCFMWMVQGLREAL